MSTHNVNGIHNVFMVKTETFIRSFDLFRNISLLIWTASWAQLILETRLKFQVPRLIVVWLFRLVCAEG